jgi:hypothetical protein
VRKHLVVDSQETYQPRQSGILQQLVNDLPPILNISMQQPHPTISLQAHVKRLLCAMHEPGTPIYFSAYMPWLEMKFLVASPMSGAHLLAVIQVESQGNARARMLALEQRLGIVILEDSGLSIATPRA